MLAVYSIRPDFRAAWLEECQDLSTDGLNGQHNSATGRGAGQLHVAGGWRSVAAGAILCATLAAAAVPLAALADPPPDGGGYANTPQYYGFSDKWDRVSVTYEPYSNTYTVGWMHLKQTSSGTYTQWDGGGIQYVSGCYSGT